MRCWATTQRHLEETEAMPTVVITGASRGFGRALFDVYSQRGWTTFPLVRESGVATQLQAEGGPSCHPIVTDVSTEGAGPEMARALEQYAGALDVLINNAGSIRKHRGLCSTSVEDLEDLFRVHCVGVFRCIKSALPFLTHSERPVVVNISSRWGSIGRTQAGRGGDIYSYQIAKCAQNMLTVCLDQELKKVGIRVMAVHPGRLKTQVGAVDADTDPRVAACILADWIERVDARTACALHDLVGGTTIEW